MEIEKIHKEYLDGCNIYDLAEKYNTSHTTLYRWFKKSNLKVLNKSEAKKDDKNPHWKGGLSNAYNHIKAREIWQIHYGKIPKNHVIHHKDGNHLNNNIENLECLEEKEHLRKHIKQGDYFGKKDTLQK